MKRLVVLLAILASALALTAGAAPATATSAAGSVPQAAGRTRVLANCTHLAVKPRRVVVACADGGIYVVFRHYRSWRHLVARGRGVYSFNDCKPSCAGGTFHHYRGARLRLGHPVSTRRGPVFSRLHVRYVVHGKVHRVGYSLAVRPLG